MQKTDVLIVGAGVVGCAIARELSKYQLRVMVVDKNEDVGGDASKSNSAIIHTGYDAAPGTLESQLVVAANPMYDRLTQDLEVPFKRVGAILPAFTQEQFETLFAWEEKAENARPALVNHVENTRKYGADCIFRGRALLIRFCWWLRWRKMHSRTEWISCWERRLPA